MRTETRTLYTYDELSERAQERARDGARSSGWYGDAWAEEWRDTLKSASAVFGVSVDWEVGGRGTYCSVTFDVADVGELRGVRAWKYAHAQWAEAIAAECPFTGYCGDESFLDPLRAFLKRPALDVTLADVFVDCGASWASAWESDMEFQQSDEYVGEDLEANGHEFTKDGVRV